MGRKFPNDIPCSKPYFGRNATLLWVSDDESHSADSGDDGDDDAVDGNDNDGHNVDDHNVSPSANVILTVG